jgi:hypothetical protein
MFGSVIRIALVFLSISAEAGLLARAEVILSWDELKALSRPQRERYMEDLRELIILMEKAEASYEVGEHAGLESFRDYVAAIREEVALFPEALAEGSSAAVNLCGTVTPPCTGLSSDERKARIARFRRDKAENVCIYGANFSEYREAKPDSKRWKRAGSCEPVDYFPTKNRNRPQCAAGNVICNPVVFCIFGPDPNDNNVGKVRMFCEPKGGSATVRCKARFEKLKTEPGLHECDPGRDMEPGFKEFWNHMITAIGAKYKKYCVGDGNFAALFCEECKAIGEQLAVMNARARPAECGSLQPGNKAPIEQVSPAAIREARRGDRAPSFISVNQ